MTQPKLTRKQIEKWRDNCAALEWASSAALADFALKAIDALEFYAQNMKVSGVPLILSPEISERDSPLLVAGNVKVGISDIVAYGARAREALSLIDLGDEKAGES